MQSLSERNFKRDKKFKSLMDGVRGFVSTAPMVNPRGEEGEDDDKLFLRSYTSLMRVEISWKACTHLNIIDDQDQSISISRLM